MTKHLKGVWSILIVALAVMLAAVLSGCDSKSTSDSDTSGTGVAVTATPSAVTNGSTSVVEARVTAAGAGVSGQTVNFTVSPSTAGYFTPSSATTDASGYAGSVFTATSNGSATVTASVNGTSYSGTANVTVNSAQTGSGNINLTVSPSLLLANGSDTSNVTIVVRDAASQPAPDLTVVKITAGEKFVDIDGNGYWSGGIDSLVFDANANGQWDAFGLIPSSAVISGGAGSVSVDYVSGNDALTVYIKVTVDDNGILGAAEIPLQVNPNAEINSIFLASDSINLVVKQTGGIETALLHATGFDLYGNPVPEGMTINFIITDGPGGGEHLASVGYGPYPAVTNSQGTASVPISSGTASGTVRIRAYADTVLSNATQVMVSAGPPAYIVVGAEECNVPYWDNVNEQVGIVAVVSDIYNNPVPDSTVVYFTTDEGTMKSHEERTMELEGIATTKWISGNNVSTADGVVLVIAETSGGTVMDTSYFVNSHFPDTLIVNNMPVSMPADGTSRVTVTVIGIDYNVNNYPGFGDGIPVVGGTTFEAEANYLSVVGGTLQDGCSSSSDRVRVTSKVLDIDYSLTGGNDDGIGAYDVVQYFAGPVASSFFTVAVTTGTAYSGNSSVNAASSAAPGEAVNVSAIIKDRWSNPLGDHTLVLTVPAGGVVSGGTQETNAYGEASGFVWTAPAGAGDYTLVITDTDPRGGIVITAKVTVE